MIDIDKDVPMPEAGRRGPKLQLPWLTMDVGDSFLLSRGIPPYAYQRTSTANKRYAPRQFRCRKISDGYRIWRTQ